MDTPTFEQIGERWRWVVYQASSGVEYHTLAESAATFSCREEANENYEIYRFCRLVDGRHLVTKDELNKMLKLTAEMAGCPFSGYAVPSTPSFDGRNWEIQWSTADNQTKHLMWNAVNKLRANYNIEQ